MIDFFIGRMTVLGRGLVFQPVLVTQTCTYNSKYITLTLQFFHQREREREREGGSEGGREEREGGRGRTFRS